MPFLHFSTTKIMSRQKKTALSKGIIECVKLLPGKPAERAMIRIDDNCDIFRGGEIAECAFMETIYQKPLSEEACRAYIEALYDLMKKELELDVPQCYFAMVDLDTWGSRGTLH
ncbi:MAG: phenylpyruvate tautomerase MIF-related protein [Hespellia sp.]|nr:phenylpyruvate tautomerase MIF-related protein [Hespellia sp.]